MYIGFGGVRDFLFVFLAFWLGLVFMLFTLRWRFRPLFFALVGMFRNTLCPSPWWLRHLARSSVYLVLTTYVVMQLACFRSFSLSFLCYFAEFAFFGESMLLWILRSSTVRTFKYERKPGARNEIPCFCSRPLLCAGCPHVSMLVDDMCAHMRRDSWHHWYKWNKSHSMMSATHWQGWPTLGVTRP